MQHNFSPSATRNSPLLTLLPTQVKTPDARETFFNLFSGPNADRVLEDAEQFLHAQLKKAASLESDLPADMNDLFEWMQNGVEEVGLQYRAYLDARQAGGERRYFRNKAHALYFLKCVAPTKMVDGAWLYGLLPRWNDARFLALIQTYLEELGEGLPSKNHVTLYRKLLASQGCERWDDLSENHYVQGAIQLSLAYRVEHFLPEVIGFNLGYEQLPLHLLISAYELKELGVDPYYFTLHITVDNADSGHAKKAVDAIFDAMPRVGDTADFYRRVCNGYKLNLLGASTDSVIGDFDLQAEMTAIFSRKGAVGQYAHSDYRRVAGRTINDWLSKASQTGDLLAAMEKEGWFKRDQDPQNSRFCKLIQSEKARMFGVFSLYEQQIIHDWIAADKANEYSFKPRKDAHSSAEMSADAKRHLLSPLPTENNASTINDDFNAEERELEQRLAATQNRDEAMALLIAQMSPANHHSAAGLLATRLFTEILEQHH